MSTRYTTKARRGMAAVAIAAGLALAVAGCGSDDPKPEASSSSAPSGKQDDGSQQDPEESPQEVLAELKGGEGFVLTLNSAKRDSGGFVTVNGQIKNAGDRAKNISSALSGNETEILRHGRSLGGATLVDSEGKKRYYVLRDTEGRPLTTTGMRAMKPGESIPIFMQFPAPPEGTSEVSFQLPTFASATIEISE
ncbi:hypothetical protein [Streptomyces meridianus]|uniref:Secreted protein n=1 Tax=Streptomyces meridianus TaxID=2938945 RepID=A0ABT0X170_9ACTN|nr:hypothetical protein [Streptomyces meridianus]MCM2576309.1 hypothetical protein [Streptomyces meridianus]